MKPLVLAILAACLLALVPGQAEAQSRSGEQADMTIVGSERSQLIDSVIEQVDDNYVFPEQAAKVQKALRKHQQLGRYDTVTSAKQLSELLTNHMQAASGDRHLTIYYSERPIPDRDKSAQPTAEQKAARMAQFKEMNYGVERVERLPFNIGYLDLRGFVRAIAAAPAIASAMTLLANTDALIIDLRRNGGGDAGAVNLLASYLFDGRTQLNNMYYRNGNRIEQMWTSDVVMGERFGQEKDVYILTSKDTFSAAEAFSFALKNLKRATIVGETTGGGAHPGDMVRLRPHFEMFMPLGRAYNPATNLSWESVGVAPDVRVKAEDALKTAQLLALKKMAAAENNPDVRSYLNSRIAKVQAENTAGTLDD